MFFRFRMGRLGRYSRRLCFSRATFGPFPRDVSAPKTEQSTPKASPGAPAFRINALRWHTLRWSGLYSKNRVFWGGNVQNPAQCQDLEMKKKMACGPPQNPTITCFSNQDFFWGIFFSFFFEKNCTNRLMGLVGMVWTLRKHILSP